MKRRSFLNKSATAAFGFQVVSSHVVRAQDGKAAPNDKLRIAGIGCGGRGAANLNGMKDEAIVALCDVDKKRADGSFKKFGDAKRFTDYREMFATMGDEIDAVLVATPDHTHSTAVLEAIKHGKHVYCEKPLAHSVAEVRAMRQAALDKKVITQVGNQGHSSDHIRLFCEMVWDGLIGEVQEVHAGCDAFKEVYCQINKAADFQKHHEVPENLDWSQWLGPLYDRPYHPNYLPFNWRGYSAFGSGCIGDWVCHVLDPIFWALDLELPTAITAETKGYDPKIHSEFYPAGVKITFEFAATDKNGPIKVVWHDGENSIPQPKVFEGTDRKAVRTGAIVYGSEGAIMHGSHGAGGCRLIPEERMKDFKRPEERLARVPGGQHQKDWISAIRAGKEAGSSFEYGGALSEIGLLGMIAIKRSGKRLEWDSKAMKFTNDEFANTLVHSKHREQA